MRQLLSWCIAFLVLFAIPAVASSDNNSDCGGLLTSTCTHVHADQQQGDFHGLIMVPGRPSVLDTAAHSGTKAGCGDCTWELILACLRNNPNDPGNQDPCTGAVDSGQCRSGQLLFRLYLTTDAVQNRLVDMVCLGGITDVVPVGDRAAADVQRYLKDVSPPLLDLHVAPPKGIPAGMPAYFWVRPPDNMTPTPFGNGQITETITIAPQRYSWTWGDGAVSGWTTDAGGPYPDGTLTHTYSKADHYTGQVNTEWGGTYTITVAGQTFGPYAAIGTITKSQPFSTVVLRARSTLVSH
jgi:hypothetical protein